MLEGPWWMLAEKGIGILAIVVIIMDFFAVKRKMTPVSKVDFSIKKSGFKMRKTGSKNIYDADVKRS